MEISEISKLSKTHSLQKREGVQRATHVEDRVSISSEAISEAIEAQKKADWVAMLREMPSVHPERIIAEKIYAQFMAD